MSSREGRGWQGGGELMLLDRCLNPVSSGTGTSYMLIVCLYSLVCVPKLHVDNVR